MKKKALILCFVGFVVIWLSSFCVQAGELFGEYIYGNTWAHYKLLDDELHDASVKLKIKDKEFSSNLFPIIEEDIWFYISVKGSYRVGTKYTISVFGKNDNDEDVTYSYTGKILNPYIRCSWKYLIKDNKKFNVKISNTHKGDVLTLKIGKKTYKKKLKNSAREKAYTVKINKAKAGANVYVMIKNKYKQTVYKNKTRVYRYKGFKYGMTMKQMKNVAGFSDPKKIISTQSGTYWYYDRNRDNVNESWILFYNGKVVKWRILN